METVEGQPLPVVVNDEATCLNVCRFDDGVVLTLSTSNGRVYAGTLITREDWQRVVSYIEGQFKGD